MARGGSTQSPTHFAFGPFKVDVLARELLKHGISIRLSGQRLQILLVLLAHPGELITREQLCEEVWRGETFVDFEHGLNAAMNKLRRALGDSAENPRYIETVTGRGYRFIGNLEPVPSMPAPSTGSPEIPKQLSVRRRVPVWYWLGSIAACVAVSFIPGRRFQEAPAPLPAWTLTRLTSDTGLSNAPSISPDGKLLAYSSDSGVEGERDLYVKQVAGGLPIRLTLDGAENTTPDFSPDGNRIVFRSNRDGGGIYEIPVFGGDVRLLARDGLNPRFSPDGSKIVYWTGAPNVAPTVPGTGLVWVVPVTGGHPQRVGRTFTTARYPIWAPDGRHILLAGYTSAKAFDSNSIDWWLVDAITDHTERTGAFQALIRAGLHGSEYGTGLLSSTYTIAETPRACCWLGKNNRLVFSLENGDSRNLWETGISPGTGKVTGVFNRLTAGAGSEMEPSCASANALAFANVAFRSDVWSVPFDLDRGKPLGALERITDGPARREHASLSENGRYVAFASSQSGEFNIWQHELATGKELHLAGSPYAQRFPLINASGSKVAFSSYEKDKRIVYVSTPGGVPEKLCEGCLRATDWSLDETTLLIFGGSPYQISLFDVASHRQTSILKHPADNLLYARFSPDNRWVSFTDRIAPQRARIVLAPVDRTKPVPASAWITIAEGGPEDWANWSTDGKTLYFTSGRDGHACLWGQRIDPESHRPVGAAFAAQHLHGRLSYQQGGWSAAGGRIAMVLAENTGNIWMMSRAGPR